MEYQIQTEQQFVFICIKVRYENIGEAANGNRVHIGAWTRVKVDNRSSDTETDEPSFITLCLVGFMITNDKDKSINTLVSCLQCNSVVVVWGCLVRPECGGGGRNHTQMEILRPGLQSTVAQTWDHNYIIILTLGSCLLIHFRCGKSLQCDRGNSPPVWFHNYRHCN